MTIEESPAWVQDAIKDIMPELLNEPNVAIFPGTASGDYYAIIPETTIYIIERIGDIYNISQMTGDI